MHRFPLFFALLFFAFGSFAQNPLAIPPALNGTEFELNLQNGSRTFFPGFTTNTMGVNGDLLGPTLILNRGDLVTMNVHNNLGEPSTIHWHGMHVAAANDGGPHTVIEAGTTWSPQFEVLDKAATYWYHPHLHMKTAEHVTKGIAGFIIVKDSEEAALGLPRTYGTDDFPIVMQSRAFDANKQFVVETALDDVMLVNGTVDPNLELPAQVVRLRLLNGATDRAFNLGFEGNLTFHQIATDGGLLAAPVTLTRLRLAPGERAEILLELAGKEGQSFYLKSFASELPSGIYGATNPSIMPVGSIPNYGSNPLNDNDFDILRLDVIAATANAVNNVPATLATLSPIPANAANITRNLTFQPQQMGPTGMVNGPFVINGASFNLNTVNYEIPLDNTEIWQLTNQTGISHPFHIHDVQFFILDINGAAPPANQQGRKDVVLVPPGGGTVRFITQFSDFADEVPYMYHCHMLTHEDAGMMGQFVVVGNATGIGEHEKEAAILYPNPTSNIITLSGLGLSTIKIYGSSGQLFGRMESVNGDVQFDLTEFTAGVYYFNIISPEKTLTYSVVKK